MTTQLSTKLAALAVALMVNALMLGAVGYLFSAQLSRHLASQGPLTTSARAGIPTL
jgi:uncharacterized membrane protein YsdA (DUF1294 family)